MAAVTSCENALSSEYHSLGVRGGDILENEAGRAEEKEEVSLRSLLAYLFSLFPKKRLIRRLQISFRLS